MWHGDKKVAKIVEEMTMFFFSLGADRISSQIEKNEEEAKLTFRAKYLPEHEHGIHSLEKCLNEPKNEAIEGIYWELAGSGDAGNNTELLLIGMMVDRYELQKFDHEIELTLYKKFRKQ